MKSDGKFALGERESVAEMKTAVHVRVGEGDHVLLLFQTIVARGSVFLEDVLLFPSEIFKGYPNHVVKLKKHVTQSIQLFKQVLQ